MNPKILPLLFASAAVALTSAPSLAQTLTIDFDDGTTNPFGVGTISSDQADSGSFSLRLDGDNYVEYILPAEFQGKPLSIQMSIFDEGRWFPEGSGGSDMGPRWGVGSGDLSGEFVAAGIINLSYIFSGLGYGRPNSTENFLGAGSGNSWFSATWYDYDNDRTNPGEPFNVPGEAAFMSATGDGSAGTGQWFEWVYETTADGLVTWSNTSNPATIYEDMSVGAAVDRLLIFGGDTGDALAGTYVDSISVTVVPEPRMWALIAMVGAAAFVGVRRRRGA